MAENELDIPALLDAEDMLALSVPDKLSVATYLVQYYNYFKDKAPSSLTPSANVPVQRSAATPAADSVPPTKRTKVETIGPSDVSPPRVQKVQSSPLIPPIKKAVPSSPSVEQKTTPTHKTSPVKPPSPLVVKASTQVEKKAVEEKKNSSKENTPEPAAESANRVKKGRRSKFKPGGAAVKNGTMGKEICDVCGERVFLMERLSVEGHVFHRPCFKCFTCKCLLKPGSYEHDSAGDLFYCQPHYREALRQSTLKRTMAQRGLTNGDEALTVPTEVKKKKEDSPPSAHSSSPSPKHEITREESQKIKAGLPGLLKSLAGTKANGGEERKGGVTSPKHTTVTSPKHTIVASPTKAAAANADSAVIPAKPPPPQTTTVSSKIKSIESNVGEGGEPVKPPTGPPRRPTWSPKPQPRDLPKKTVESPTAPHEPPRRPTWSPKVPHEPPKRPAKAPTESVRRPTWSPKVQPVGGERSRGELPKSTVGWLAKGKVGDSAGGQSSPVTLRHATVSGIPQKPSPPVTSRKVEEKKMVSNVIKEETPTVIPTTPSPAASPAPIKPPRRKKTGDKVHAAESEERETKTDQPLPAPTPSEEAKKPAATITPKRVAPPRPFQQPSLKRSPVSGEWKTNLTSVKR